MPELSHKTWVWIGVAVGAVVLAAIAFVFLGNAEVTVPAVTGMKSADAVRTLEGAGFKLGATEQVVSTDTVPGVVLAQTPEGGSKAKKGAPIDLKVAKAQDLIGVPDVKGQEVGAATAMLEQAGLTSVTYSDYSTSTPAGQVFGQVPAGGTQALPGAQVALGVSLGPAPAAGVVVPKVVGKTQADASAALQNAGFDVQVGEGYSDKVPAGQVIAQLPAGGTKALAGTTVGISVSKGKAPSNDVTVPNVVGDSKSDAIAQLQVANLEAETYEVYSSSVPKGNVVGQIPAAGSKVAKGTVIGLAISKGKAPTTVKVPNVVGKSSEEASKAIASLGLDPVAVEVNSDTVPAGQVIEQSPVAGSLVPPQTQVLFAVSKGPANKPTPY